MHALQPQPQPLTSSSPPPSYDTVCGTGAGESLPAPGNMNRHRVTNQSSAPQDVTVTGGRSEPNRYNHSDRPLLRQRAVRVVRHSDNQRLSHSTLIKTNLLLLFSLIFLIAGGSLNFYARNRLINDIQSLDRKNGTTICAQVDCDRKVGDQDYGVDLDLVFFIIGAIGAVIEVSAALGYHSYKDDPNRRSSGRH